ncbi:MAG: DUF4124 domain-containing protein [Serpentinimonas sp.]|nr:DUF4124 domain-containing protein [Serpentinimonas sp.]
MPARLPALLAAAASVVLGWTAQPAWAVQRCVEPGGRVVFQDKPCPGRGGEVLLRPANPGVPPEPVPQAAAPVAVPQESEVERLNRLSDQMQAQRRRQELELYLVPRAQNQIAQHRAQCDREYRDLQGKKTLANNNLAGATWEQSISTEMAALAARCDSRSRELLTNLELVRSECRALSGCGAP